VAEWFKAPVLKTWNPRRTGPYRDYPFGEAIEFHCAGRTPGDRAAIADELVALVRSIREEIIQNLRHRHSTATSTRARVGPGCVRITLSTAPWPLANRLVAPFPRRTKSSTAICSWLLIPPRPRFNK
jgi:hypothetical protein